MTTKSTKPAERRAAAEPLSGGDGVAHFVISFLTNIILGQLVPHIISGFHGSLTVAAVPPFSLFMAYGVQALEREGEL